LNVTIMENVHLENVFVTRDTMENFVINVKFKTELSMKLVQLFAIMDGLEKYVI